MAESVKVGSIFAEIRAKLDNYDRDLKEARKMTETQMGALQKSVDKLSFKKAGDSVMDFAKKAAAAFALYKAFDFTKNATMAAARYETLGIVLDRLSQNTNYTTSELKAFQDQLEKTGISMIESRQVLLMMIQANLDLGKSSELARVAQDAAVGANLNSSETLVRMTHAIAANSVEVMRTIGLEVNFESATRKLAASLGTTTANLTEAQKMQARMNATIEAGAQVSGAYEAAFGTASKQLNSFARYISNFQVEFGKAFNPALTAIVFGASEAMKSLTEVIKDPQFQESMTQFANEMSIKLVEGMKWLSENKGDVAGYFRGIATGMESIVKFFNMLPKEAWGAILGFAVTRSPYGAVAGAGIALVNRMTEENRTLLQYMEDQVKEQEKLVSVMEQGQSSGLDFFKIRDGENKADLEYQKAKLEDLKDALRLQYEQIDAAKKAREVAKTAMFDVSDNHKYNIGGRFSPGYKAAMPEPKSKEQLAEEKKTQDQIDKFWEEYKKTTSSAFEFEKFKLDKSLAEWKGYINNKQALNTMYHMKYMELKTKEMIEESKRMVEPRSEAFSRERIEREKTVLKETSDAENYYWALQANQANEQLMKKVAEYEKTYASILVLTERTADAMQQNFSDLFFDAMTGKLKTFEDYAQAVFTSIQRMFADMAAQMLTEKLFGDLSKTGGGGGGGGWLGALIGMVGGNKMSVGQVGGQMTASQTAASNLPINQAGYAGAELFHSGGIVGVDHPPKRMVPSWIFNGAPRLHGGLKSNERPVIMEKGEEVIRKEDVGKQQPEKPQLHIHLYPNSQGQYDRESVSEAQARIYSSMSRANQRNR